MYAYSLPGHYLLEMKRRREKDLIFRICSSKYYNCLQLILKHKVFTKVIKIQSWKAWVQRPSGLILRGRKSNAFG